MNLEGMWYVTIRFSTDHTFLLRYLCEVDLYNISTVKYVWRM